MSETSGDMGAAIGGGAFDIINITGIGLAAGGGGDTTRTDLPKVHIWT